MAAIVYALLGRETNMEVDTCLKSDNLWSWGIADPPRTVVDSFGGDIRGRYRIMVSDERA